MTVMVVVTICSHLYSNAFHLVNILMSDWEGEGKSKGQFLVLHALLVQII